MVKFIRFSMRVVTGNIILLQSLVVFEMFIPKVDRKNDDVVNELSPEL